MKIKGHNEKERERGYFQFSTFGRNGNFCLCKFYSSAKNNGQNAMVGLIEHVRSPNNFIFHKITSNELFFFFRKEIENIYKN